ncbi:MAG: hypothetical protein RIS70_4381 [Planctomycetota bacterium]
MVCGKSGFHEACMHELGLAQNILDIVREHTPANRIAAVRRVRVDVGRMAGVVVESLDFCFSTLIATTPMSSARLECRTVPLRVACETCGGTSECEGDWFVCPGCGSSRTRVVAGMDLRVSEIELEDDPGQGEWGTREREAR